MGNKAKPLTYERTINQASLIYPRIKGSGTLPSSFNCMSALSEKLKVPRPIKQFSTARKSLDLLSRASGSDKGSLFYRYK